MSTSGLDIGFNLQDLLKKVLLAFCEVHISFAHRLDIYGSIHVRSDDSDLTCFVLNEHSYKQTDLRNKDSDLTRYISSVNGSLAVENVCHQNSNFSGQVLPSTSDRNLMSGTAESSAQGSSLCEPDSGHEDRRVFNKRGGKVTKNVETHPTVHRMRSAAADPASDTDKPSSDTHHASSNTPDSKPQDTSTEAETWPESTYDAVNEPDPSPLLMHDEQKTTSCIKNEEQDQEQDSLGTVKLEPANENEIIELESDEEGYDQSNESMFAYGQSAYENSGMYPGYPPSSLPNAQSNAYSQVAWMQRCTSFQSMDDSQAFSAMNSTKKPPPPQKVCSYCLKCFTTTVQLRMHVQRYHSTTPALEGASATLRRRQGMSDAVPGTPCADKRLTCSICMLSFRSLDGLRCHENSKHSRNKVYNCQYCSQVFLTRQAAYTHRTKFHRMKIQKNENTV